MAKSMELPRQSDEITKPELELIRDPTSIRLGLETRIRLSKALRALDATGMKASDFVRLAVIRLLDEMDETGTFKMKLSVDAIHAPAAQVLESERKRRNASTRSSSSRSKS